MAEFGGQSPCWQTEGKSKEWCNQLWQSLEGSHRVGRLRAKVRSGATNYGRVWRAVTVLAD